MSILKDSSIYLVGEIIAKALPFFLIPYFSRRLGVEGYGELAYYQAYTTLLVILCGILQESAVTRYFYFYGKNGMNLIVRTGYLYTLLIGGVFFLVSLFLKLEILPYIVISAIFEIFITVQLSIRQVQKQAFSYIFIQISSGILSALLTIFMFEYFQEKLVEKRILAILSSNILIFLLSYILYKKNIKRNNYSFRHYKIALLYILSLGIPMVFHMLSFFIKGQIDRFFIYHRFSQADLGLYAMGANISLILMAIINAINKAITPYYLEGIKENKITLYKVHKWFFLSLIIPFILVGIVFILPEQLLLYFLGEQFVGTKYYVTIFTFSVALAIPYSILVNYLFYFGKNKQIAYCSVMSAIIYIITLVGLSFTNIQYIPFASVFAAASILPFLYFITIKTTINKSSI